MDYNEFNETQSMEEKNEDLKDEISDEEIAYATALREYLLSEDFTNAEALVNEIRQRNIDKPKSM